MYILYFMSIVDFSIHAKAGVIPFFSDGEQGNLRALCPSLNEQEQIATFLDHETASIDTLIAKTKLSIDILKERRSAFITAAVTGQIDIREAA